MPTGNANKPQLEMRGRDLKAYVYNNNIAFMKDPRISDLQEFGNIQLGIIIVQTSTVNYLLMLLQLKWNPRAFITN